MRIAENRIQLDRFRSTDSQSDFIIPADVEIGPWIKHLTPENRIFIVIEEFNDGRIFSVGRQIRISGFTGELTAVGDFLPDQLGCLAQCGFDQCRLEIDGEKIELHD